MELFVRRWKRHAVSMDTSFTVRHQFCTDNAAMIGVAAYYEYKKGTRHGWDLNAVPNLKIGEKA